MWNYEKRLEYPVNITTTNPKLAQLIISQYGGPDGEMGASMRYLSQRYSMPYRDVAGVLTDIGSEASEMPLLSYYFIPFIIILWKFLSHCQIDSVYSKTTFYWKNTKNMFL